MGDDGSETHLAGLAPFCVEVHDDGYVVLRRATPERVPHGDRVHLDVSGHGVVRMIGAPSVRVCGLR